MALLKRVMVPQTKHTKYSSRARDAPELGYDGFGPKP